MSDLAGGILKLKSPFAEADNAMLFDVLKVAADRGICVTFDGNIVQGSIHEMIGLPIEDDAIAFALTASPRESTAEELIKPDGFVFQGSVRDGILRRNLAAIRDVVAAAFSSRRVSRVMVVFSAASPGPDPFYTQETDLAGFVDVCMPHLSPVEAFVPSVRIWIREA
ncbi:MAG: hypothetical protein KF889_27635 [Alphaproteobacteria bacterium]|nr:hypothetical protein [Alphaproteobacteria bacterium]MCW5743727.1 hypothetical protein [Alphaproteobacteria bacterium]